MYLFLSLQIFPLFILNYTVNFLVVNRGWDYVMLNNWVLFIVSEKYKLQL